MNDVHSHRRHKCIPILLMLIVGLLISGCGPKRPPTATSAIVRGSIISVALPVTPTGREVIGVDKDKTAQRSFVPRSDPMATNTVLIPGPLWNELEALRQAWCIDPPVYVRGKPTDADYKVIFDCGLVSQYEPIFAVPPDRLPPALRELIELVPPAP